MRWTLPARPPFSLPAVIRSHGWVQLAPFHSVDFTNLSYVDALSSGRMIELRIAPAPEGVSVEVPGQLKRAEQAEVSHKVAWMLGLEQDFAPFYALARREPKLAHAEAQGQGRVLRSPTLFEDAVKTILTTNTTWSGTIRMNQALVDLFGEPLPSGDSRRSFPSPRRLATSDVEALRSQARLGYRAPYVLELAQRVASGELDLEALKDPGLPTDELRKRLLAIKGIGGYAAANLLVILGRYDFVPVDSWALKLVSHEWHSGEPVGETQVREAFEAWGEWKGLAFWFWKWEYNG
ncbi:MAG: hypothetical protein PHS96_01950 [Anaerolineales bacterium]|nr:hypothetical protein [Anaerolineales bacterium]